MDIDIKAHALAELRKDRDHWKQQAGKNHAATLEAMQENDRLREALRAADELVKAIERERKAEASVFAVKDALVAYQEARK